MMTDQLLKEENKKLQNALQDALQLKLEAAQYGLRILEEKQQLQAQYDELLRKFDDAGQELILSKQKLEEQSLLHRRLSKAGLEEEQDFLSEYTDREQRLINQVMDLEVELKEVRAKFDRQMADNDGLHQRMSEQQGRFEDLNHSYSQLKAELKEAKRKEVQLTSDLEDLEAENLDLQKTILSLKTSQVEFESLRHEYKRMQEENDIIHNQLEEITRLKRMTERSLEEALESLQIERDQRHNLKRELDSRFNSESLLHTGNLRNDLKGSINLAHTALEDIANLQYPMETFGSPILSQVGTCSTPNAKEETCPPDVHPNAKRISTDHSSPNDLLSELKSSEFTKFQAEFAQLEAERNELERKLEETERSLEIATSEVSNKQERINGLLAQLDAIMSVKSLADSEFETKGSERDLTLDPPDSLPNGTAGDSLVTALTYLDENDMPSIASHPAFKNLRKALRIYENRYSVALRQISSLNHDLRRYQEREKLNDRPELATEKGLKDELLCLQTILDERTEEIKRLQNTVLTNQEASCDTNKKLDLFCREIHRGLVCLFDIYSFVCSTIQETPNKQMQELADRCGVSLSVHNSSPEHSVASEVTATTEDGHQFISLDSSDVNRTETVSAKLDEHLTAISQLRLVVGTFVGKYVQTIKQSAGQSSADLDEAQQQVLRLKSALETKREQVVTLRNMLRANKTTAETALANLKQKYENEKITVSDTMQRLRNELKTLKEDAATYASLRAMFAQRYDEYITQMDELQRKLNHAEEEKRTLNSLLRLAIQQKLSLTQRLEEAEVELEQRRGVPRHPQSHLQHTYAVSQVFHPTSFHSSIGNSLLPHPIPTQASYPGGTHNQRRTQQPLCVHPPSETLPTLVPDSFPQTTDPSAHPTFPVPQRSTPNHQPVSGTKALTSGGDRPK
ncbi:unnamed protein product [Dicrocoelium dendriticum]|nr:unnamed protein product [Dicrocoelium dendriticum]